MKLKRSIFRVFQVALAIVDVTVIVALLICAFGGYIDPRTWSMPAVACLALPFVAALAVLWLAVTALMRHWRGTITTLVALLISLPQLLTVVSIGAGAPSLPVDAPLPHGSVTVMSFNVCGTGLWKYNKLPKPNPLISYVINKNADIVVFQEGSLGGIDYERIPAISVIKDELNAAYPYRERGYHDVMLLSKYPYKRLNFDSIIDPDWINPDKPTDLNFDLEGYDVELPGGRSLRVIGFHLQAFGLQPADKEFYVDVTHGKAETRQDVSRFKTNLIDKLRHSFKAQAAEAELIRRVIDASPGDVVVCGDMNNVAPSWPYRTIRGNDMRDVFTELERGYMRTYNRHRMYFHIDHMFYRGNLRPVAFERGDTITSDHFPLITTFEY